MHIFASNQGSIAEFVTGSTGMRKFVDHQEDYSNLLAVSQSHKDNLGEAGRKGIVLSIRVENWHYALVTHSTHRNGFATR